MDPRWGNNGLTPEMVDNSPMGTSPRAGNDDDDGLDSLTAFVGRAGHHDDRAHDLYGDGGITDFSALDQFAFPGGGGAAAPSVELFLQQHAAHVPEPARNYDPHGAGMTVGGGPNGGSNTGGGVGGGVGGHASHSSSSSSFPGLIASSSSSASSSSISSASLSHGHAHSNSNSNSNPSFQVRNTSSVIRPVKSPHASSPGSPVMGGAAEGPAQRRSRAPSVVISTPSGGAVGMNPGGEVSPGHIAEVREAFVKAYLVIDVSQVLTVSKRDLPFTFNDTIRALFDMIVPPRFRGNGSESLLGKAVADKIVAALVQHFEQASLPANRLGGGEDAYNRARHFRTHQMKKTSTVKINGKTASRSVAPCVTIRHPSMTDDPEVRAALTKLLGMHPDEYEKYRLALEAAGGNAGAGEKMPASSQGFSDSLTPLPVCSNAVLAKVPTPPVLNFDESELDASVKARLEEAVGNKSPRSRSNSIGSEARLSPNPMQPMGAKRRKSLEQGSQDGASDASRSNSYQDLMEYQAPGGHLKVQETPDFYIVQVACPGQVPGSLGVEVTEVSITLRGRVVDSRHLDPLAMVILDEFSSEPSDSNSNATSAWERTYNFPSAVMPTDFVVLSSDNGLAVIKIRKSRRPTATLLGINL